jgi:diguanylate cyclase (GGDEF)-like protein/putative nucleotidyltransferase with HDIG domain
MLVGAGRPNWSELGFYLAATVALAGMRFRASGSLRTVSPAVVPLFAAISTQPAWVIAMLSVVACGSEALWRALGTERQSATDEEFDEVPEATDSSALSLLVEFAAAPLAAAAATSVHLVLADAVGLPVLVVVLAAAAIYFGVVAGAQAVEQAIHGTNILDRWAEGWLANIPQVLVAPIGVLLLGMTVNSGPLHIRLLGAALLGVLYAGLRAYFPALHSRKQHADRMANVRQQALETLAVAIEAKDGSTAGHLQRVRLHASRLAKRMGCNDDEIRTIRLAAVLHDVGKVGVPDYILMKPSRLSQREFDTITRHAQIGADIVASMRFPEPVADVVVAHHEHWDGSGYPRGLVGEDIPRLARIFTVVDFFDALVSERPYRRALSINSAIRLMRDQRGKIFDPEICDAFLAQIPEHLDDLKEQLESERTRLLEEGVFTSSFKQIWAEDDTAQSETDKHAKLQKLTQAPERLMAFYEILQALGADLDFARSFATCLEKLRNVCPFDHGGIYLIEDNSYLLVSAEGLPEHCVSRLRFGSQTEPFLMAAQSGVPIISDLAPRESTDSTPAAYMRDVKSSLVAPLSYEGRHVGAVLLTSDRADWMTEEHGLFLSLITDKLAQALVSSQKLQKLTFDAQTDETTGLANARASFQKLEEELLRAERQGTTVGVLFMDINGLKPINDCYGHSAGDKLLSDTGRKLTESLRGYDFVGRIGGDEFLAILPGVTSEGIEERVRVLKRHVSAAPIEVVHGVNARAVISVGAVLYPHDGTNADDLMYASDRRMYEDKEASRSDLLTLPPGTSYVSDPSSTLD